MLYDGIEQVILKTAGHSNRIKNIENIGMSLSILPRLKVFKLCITGDEGEVSAL